MVNLLIDFRYALSFNVIDWLPDTAKLKIIDITIVNLIYDNYASQILYIICISSENSLLLQAFEVNVCLKQTLNQPGKSLYFIIEK